MRTYAQVFSYRKFFLEKYIPSYFLSDYLRICFKFEEEDEKKDTEAMKKERFGAIMGMMQVTFYLIISLSSVKSYITGDASPWSSTKGTDWRDGGAPYHASGVFYLLTKIFGIVQMHLRR